MTPELTAGDVDGDWENAYFSGEEAPGGDNPSPDQNVVDDIGKALGVEYQDDEELQGERQGRRTRRAPLGAGPGLLRGLQGQEVRTFETRTESSRRTVAARSPSEFYFQFELSYHRHHLAHDLVDRFSGRVDDHGVGRRVERRCGAGAIDLVSRGQRRPDLADRIRSGRMGRIGRAPARAFLGRRVEIQLDVGLRKDDGADVAPFHHDAAAGAELPLTFDQHVAARAAAAPPPPPPDRSPASGSRASRPRRRSSRPRRTPRCARVRPSARSPLHRRAARWSRSACQPTARYIAPLSTCR